MRRGKKWLPKGWAARVPASLVEPMAGNHPRRGLTLHNEGVDRECSPGHVVALARYVVQRQINYHAVWCPRCGQWAQCAPLTAAARSMVGGPVWNGASANKAGQRNIQICVAAYGYRDFTRTPLRGAWVIAEIMDAHQIPWRARKVWGNGASRSVRSWMHSGIHGHQHGPRDDHTDPSDIDIRKLMREARRQQKARQKAKR